MRTACLVLIALRLSIAADAAIESYFPQGTKAIVGIRLRAISDAGLFQGVDAEIKKTTDGLLAKSLLAGFDPLKDLDEVIIATTGAGEKPPGVAILRGRFPISKVPEDAPRYQGIPVIESPQGMMAMIDETTAIAGEPADVRAAIDHRSEAVRPVWVSRVQALRSKCAIWGFGEGLDTAAVSGGQPGLPPIDGFEFGAAFEHGLRLAAEIHLGSAQDAEKLASSLKLLEAAMKGPKTSPKGSGFTLRIEKQTVKFSLIVSESEMKKAVAEEKGTLIAALSSGLPALMKSSQPTGMRPTIAVAPVAPVSAPKAPVSTETKIVSNSDGDTVVVTLPGGPIKQ